MAMPLNDREGLVDALTRGEVVEFADIYRAYLPRVRGVCRRYLSDPRDVEEAVQDTFTKAAAALSRFNGSFRLGAWLARIATNSAIDISRRNERRRESVSPVTEHLAEVGVVDENSAEAQADAHQLLKTLRPDHARALYLRAVEGASLVEIGTALGRSPDQTKALLHRARESLRRTWRDLGGRVAFAGVAGAFGLWRVYRAFAAASPGAARIQTAAAETFAAPAAFMADAWPMV